MKRLPKEFVEQYADKVPSWGPVGYITFKRTYARIIERTGKTEEWHEHCARLVNGLLELGAPYTEDEAFELYDVLFYMKGSVSGRAHWQLGTRTVREIGADSLQNCWALACRDLEAFTFTFDELMLGGGVGYNIQAEHVYELPRVKYKPVVEHVDTTDCNFIVPDNREGWVQLLREMLQSFFVTGNPLRYSTQCVRPAGAKIKGFGGVASGANALVTGIGQIRDILRGAHRRKLTPVECLDIMNIIGSVVVSGNVRRSAQIALGDYNDFPYLEAKNWGSGKVPAWRAMSNNSIVTRTTGELPEKFWQGYNGTGEPYGLINLDACRRFGRLIDGEDYRPDFGVLGVNPCAEITLEDREACNLAEIYLPNIRTLKEFKRVAKLLYIGCKTISRVPFSNPLSEEVSQRNHRIGIGLTGWMAAPKWRDAEKLDAVYRHLEKADRHYSKVMGLNTSIKLSTIKPSGCRSETELTVTDQGFLRVNEIIDTEAEGWNSVEGLSVLHEDKSRKVTKTYNNGVAGVYEINLSYGMSLRSTKDHPWFVTHRNGPRGANVYKHHGEWVKTCDLQENDLIETRRFNLKNNVNFVNIDQETLLLRSDAARIGQPETMTEDLAWLVGYWFGDGSLSETRHRFRIVDEYGEHLEKAQRILRDVFGVESNINPCADGRNASELSVGCKSLYHWWGLNVCSDKADGIPLCIRQSNNRQILAFTAGLVDSDGCVSGGSITLTQKDGECMRELQHILLACGIVLGRSHNIEGENLQEQKSMYLCQIALASDRDSVGILTEHSIKASRYELPEPQRSLHKVGRVKSVEYVGEQPTYDIEVDTDHWYYNGAFKSHNTLSLLPDNCPPGVHAAFGQYLIRRIRFAASDPLVDICRAHGYHVEPVQQLDGSVNHDTLVVSFPLAYGDDVVTEDQCSVFDQLHQQQFLQTHWADNSVSATHYFRPEELDGIKEWMEINYTNGVKTASFLPALDHGFAQAPLEKITKEAYEELRARTKPIVSVDDEGGFEIGGTECAGGVCPTK